MPFQKGNRVNPGGISKMPKKLRELCRARIREAVVVLSEIMNDQKQSAAARITATTALMDRAWGRPQASVHVEVEPNLTFVDVLMRAAEIEREQEAKDAKLIEG